MTPSAVERSQKNLLFVGSDSGGQQAFTVNSLNRFSQTEWPNLQLYLLNVLAKLPRPATIGSLASRSCWRRKLGSGQFAQDTLSALASAHTPFAINHVSAKK